MSAPRPPKGLGSAGRKLWAGVLADYDLAQHELAGLLQAARLADACDDLAEVVATDGRMQADHLGNVRVHPAAIELRQSQMALLRAVASLRVPLDDGDEEDAAQPQRRGASRAPYRVVA